MQFPNSFLNQGFFLNNQNSAMMPIPFMLPIPTNLTIPLNMLNVNAPSSIHNMAPVHPQMAQIQNYYQNMLLSLKLQNNPQNFLLKQSDLQNGVTTAPPSIKYRDIKLDDLNKVRVKETALQTNSPKIKPLPDLCDSNKSVKAHLKDIVYFVLNNYGILSSEEFEIEKLKYRNDKDLSTVFDVLLTRYLSAMKTREDMIKYTLKKAIKYIKKNKTKTKPFEKKMKPLLQEVSCKIEEDKSSEEVDSVSASPKPNFKTELIKEAFSTPEFCQGFQSYLQHLNSVLELDNNKKIDKFVKFIEGLIKKNSIKDIKKYKRIPWLLKWVQETKKVTFELYESQTTTGSKKPCTRSEVDNSSGYPMKSFETKIETAHNIN